MEGKDQVAICDMYKLAVLELMGLKEERHEFQGKRYRGFYSKAGVSAILDGYDKGELTASIRDFVKAIKKVKDRIFQTANPYEIRD